MPFRLRCLFGLAGMLLFCVMIEAFRPLYACLGFLAGFAGSLLHGVRPFPRGRSVPPLRLMLYLIRLPYWILRAALSTVRALFSRTAVETQIHTEPIPPYFSENARLLVANSITLTPGTATLEMEADRYVLLCLGTAVVVPPFAEALYGGAP